MFYQDRSSYFTLNLSPIIQYITSKIIIVNTQNAQEPINNQPRKLDHPKLEEVPKIKCFSVLNAFASNSFYYYSIINL